MQAHVQTVLDLVREIDPERDLGLLTFKLNLTDDGLVHVARCSATNSLTDHTSEHNADSIRHLAPCELCLSHAGYLISAISDPFVEHTATALDYFRHFGTYWDAEYVVDQALERHAQSGAPVDEFVLSLTQEWDDQHTEIDNEFAKRIIWSPADSHDTLQVAMEQAETVLDRAHYEIFRSNETLDRVAELVGLVADVNLDHRTVLSVFGPETHRTVRETRTEELVTALLTTAHRNARHERVLAEVPRWLYHALLRISPGHVHAGLYEALDPLVLDTAITLWSSYPGDIYASFDNCVAAAGRVLLEPTN